MFTKVKLHYETRGYEVLKDFPDEYLLMADIKNGLFVRLYYNGKVWEYHK